MTVNLRVSLTEKQREENKDVEGEPLHNRNAEAFFEESFSTAHSLCTVQKCTVTDACSACTRDIFRIKLIHRCIPGCCITLPKCTNSNKTDAWRYGNIIMC